MSNGKRFKKALITGKFYPPHLGHSYLINRAIAESDSVVVVVVNKSSQIIPGNLRGEWLRQMHPEVEVLVIEDIGKDNDPRAWAEHFRNILNEMPDAYFSSEDYGDLYAELIGATHVMVDRERKNVPISATRIRENPLEHFDFLAPIVRKYFMK